jgi:TetR/AcrR family transcriptional repressor of nem operon
MRKSKAETAETRLRIIDTAAREFRRNGIDGTGLADLMANAGLTHGGFYRHFDSKDQLVTEAYCAAANCLANDVRMLAAGKSQRAALKAVADAYLSTKHRDHPEIGCPLAALGSELRRADDKTKAAATEGFTGLVSTVASLIEGKRPEAARQQALAAVSMMIGALTMSRVVDDPDLSAEILKQAARQVLQIGS